MKWDVFISHASEDKEQVARPLADVLKGMGFSVWLDENELTVGDSLVDKINNGISNSRYGIVILSKNFFAKDWPQKELNALVSIETKQDKVILPIWHNLSKKDISIHSPLLADKLAVSSSSGISDLASEIVKVLEYNNTEKKPTKENELFSPKLGYFLLDKHKTSLTKNILYGVISFFAVALIAVAYETFYKKQYPESEVY
ncbi:MAG: toll/interleukin-1 receptor domain-containing protein, partial [Gammaproteobacteria bacterium]|nr:toll/interleukin-1 receptor domain-containing protein [Gammaproteobacteria bacterium]